MSPSISNEDVVLRGAFLYAGTVECDIKVVRSPVRFGSGDHEDSTEEREDSKHETFYVWYGSATERGVF